MKKLISSIHYSPLFYEDSRNIGYDVASDVAEENINDDLEQIKGWIKDYGIKVSADDLQFLEALAKEQKEKTKIIAMTANAFEEDKREAFRAGMNGHIAKPVNVKELLKLLAGIIG